MKELSPAEALTERYRLVRIHGYALALGSMQHIEGVSHGVTIEELRVEIQRYRAEKIEIAAEAEKMGITLDCPITI